MLTREDSFGSTRSGETTTSSFAAGAGLETGSILVDRTTRLDDIFGGLYLVHTQAWERSRRYIALFVIFDFIQLLQYPLSPIWNWPSFNTKNGFWNIFFYGQLQRILTQQGWSWTIGFGYALVSIVWLEVALFAYLALAARSSKGQDMDLGFWRSQIVNVLRILMCVFQDVAFFSMFNLLLVPIACDWSGQINYRTETYAPPSLLTAALNGTALNGTSHATTRLPSHRGEWGGRLLYFHEQKCFDKGNQIHAPVFVGTAVAHVALGLLAMMRRYDPNPGSDDFLTFFNTTFGVRIYGIRVLIPIIFHVLTGWKPELSSLLMLACYVAQWWYMFRRPIFNSMVLQLLQSAAAGFYALIAFMLFLAASFGSLFPWSEANLTMFLMCGYFAWLAATLSDERRRWNFMAICKFAKHKTGTPVNGVHDFVDPHEPENVVRLLLNSRGTTLECFQEVSGLIDKVLQAARLQFPNSAHVAMLQASYHCYHDKNLGLAHSLLEKARRYQGIKRMEKWEIYVLFRHKQAFESNQISGEAMDVQTYVSFNQEFKALAKQHRAAIDASKSFWTQFLRNEVKLRSVLRCFQRIESTMAITEASYRTVLERYPKSIKLLRSYGKFLMDVKNDSANGQKYISEAEKLEQVAENNAQSYGLGEATNRIDENRDAVVIIGTEGSIEFTNRNLCNMFGYSKDVLEGKNVSLLMPEPFSKQHNSYLRTYAQTGKARVLKQVREVVGLHRHGYVFPITIFVNKVNQGGSEGFLGVIKSIPEEAGVGRAWLSAAGSVLCVSRGFTDILGFKPTEIVGRYLGSYSMDAEVLSSMIAEVKDTDTGFSGGGGSREISFRHRFGGVTRISVSAHFAGTESVRLYVLTMKPVDEKTGTLVVNEEGQITFADSRLCGMLGQDRGNIEGKTMDAILSRPMGALHSGAWLKKRQGNDAPCMNERTLQLKSANNRPVFAILTPLKHLEGPDGDKNGPVLLPSAAPAVLEVTHAFKVSVSSYDAWLSEARITLVIAAPGVITSAVSPPKTLEYFSSELVGTNLAQFVEGLAPETCLEALQELFDSGHRVMRSSWKGKSGVLPAILELEKHLEGMQVNVYRVDRLEIMLEIGRNTGIIIDTSDLAHVAFGYTREELRQQTIQKILPAAFRQGRPEELLGGRGRRNDLTPEKPYIGPRVIYDGVDGTGETVLFSTLAIDEGREQSFSLFMRVVEERPVSLASIFMRQPSIAATPAARDKALAHLSIEKTSSLKMGKLNKIARTGDSFAQRSTDPSVTSLPEVAKQESEEEAAQDEGEEGSIVSTAARALSKRTPGRPRASLQPLRKSDGEEGDEEDEDEEESEPAEDPEETFIRRHSRSSYGSRSGTPRGSSSTAAGKGAPDVVASGAAVAPGGKSSRLSRLSKQTSREPEDSQDSESDGSVPEFGMTKKLTGNGMLGLAPVHEDEDYEPPLLTPNGAHAQVNGFVNGRTPGTLTKGRAMALMSGSEHSSFSDKPGRANMNGRTAPTFAHGPAAGELERFMASDYNGPPKTPYAGLETFQNGGVMVANGERDRRQSDAGVSDQDSDTNSHSSAGADIAGARVGSAKRYRKIYKIVHAGRTQVLFTKLLVWVRLGLFLVIAVQLGSLIMSVKFSGRWNTIGDSAAIVVNLPRYTYHSLTYARALMASGNNQTWWLSNPQAHSSLVKELDSISTTHQQLYLELQSNPGKAGAEILKIYNRPRITIQYPDVTGKLQTERIGLWNLVNRYVAAGKNVLFTATQTGTISPNNTDFLFMQYTGYSIIAPMYNTVSKMQAERFVYAVKHDIDNSLAVILILEMCLVIPIATFIIGRAFLRVSKIHRERFSIFLQVNKRDIFTVVTQRSAANDFDEDSDSDDETGVKNNREQQELAKLVADSDLGKQARKRKIVDKRFQHMVLTLVVPMALACAGAVGAVVAVLYSQVATENARALELFAASLLDQSAIRALYNTQELAYAAMRGQNTTFFRSEIQTSVDIMLKSLTGIMFGDADLQIKGRLLSDKRVWDHIFAYGCHVSATLGGCNPKEGNYFRRTAALDMLVHDIRETLIFALRMPDANLSDTDPRLNFAMTATTYDLRNAVNALQQVYNRHKAFTVTVQAINGLLFGLLVLACLIFYRYFVRPLFRGFRKEVEVMSGLLVQVPSSVGIEKILMQHFLEMRRTIGWGGRRRSTNDGVPSKDNAVVPVNGNQITPEMMATFSQMMGQMMGMGGSKPGEMPASTYMKKGQHQVGADESVNLDD